MHFIIDIYKIYSMKSMHKCLLLYYGQVNEYVYVFLSTYNQRLSHIYVQKK